jgi:hypothetical protein
MTKIFFYTKANFLLFSSIMGRRRCCLPESIKTATGPDIRTDSHITAVVAAVAVVQHLESFTIAALVRIARGSWRNCPSSSHPPTCGWENPRPYTGSLTRGLRRMGPSQCEARGEANKGLLLDAVLMEN